MKATPWTSVDHYENFPVGSLLVPSRLRPAVVAIYRFAREADDIADEGSASDSDRLQALSLLDESLIALSSSIAGGPDLEAQAPGSVIHLIPFVRSHDLPVEQLRLLLEAFAQDVRVKRYADRDSLLQYCSRSANPVGRLLLKLFGIDDPVSLAHSDRICSALQLINFLQDIAIDWAKGRVYLPQQTLSEHRSGDNDIAESVRTRTCSPALAAAVREESEFAQSLLDAGRPLLRRVPLRLSLELRAIMAGGQRILERIAAQGFDVFAERPRLGWRDAPAILRLGLAPAS